MLPVYNKHIKQSTKIIRKSAFSASKTANCCGMKQS